MRRLSLSGFFMLILAAAAPAAGQYYSVTYPPSEQPGELQFGVTYSVWVPDGAAKLRGVIVHQHGCGAGACKGGETAAYDLHWQALARKWECALLGPSYHQPDKANCRLWCDPRNGSEQAFLKGLRDLGAKSKHPELETIPWCLWGHSGGGFWASLMQVKHPERIVAIWFRSGTAFAAWEKGDIAKPDIPAAAYAIPIMLNPGGKEKDDKRFSGAWTGSLAMFQAYRGRGAPAGFAPDPRTAHECGDSRYLAIPYFDACLAQRLPDRGSPDSKLKPVDHQAAWLAPLLGDQPAPIAKYTGKPEEAVWLPNAAIARDWAEYVKTGATSDTTPPAAPTNVRISGQGEITWEAGADLESGLRGFIIQRDGKELARVPEKPVGRFGRPLFQSMSYHDTPEQPLPALRYTDSTAQAGVKHSYQVIAINSVGLQSPPSAAAVAARPVGVQGPVGCLDNPKRVERLEIDRPGVYENYLVDSNWAGGNRVKITANDVVLRNCEIRNATGNGVGVFATRVVIENCKIHHLLHSTFEEQHDAHGITGRWGDVTIRNCEIFYTSGDCIQFDPDRRSTGRLVIEDCTLWTGPLPADAAGFRKGQRPGENAFDSKTPPKGPRCQLIIRNCYLHGWNQPGQIGLLAALNLKENIDAQVEHCLFRDNQVAFRLRGPGSRGGARVEIRDCAIYDTAIGVRMEDRIADLRIERLGFGAGVPRKYHQAGGGAGKGYVNRGEYAAPPWEMLLKVGW